MSQRIQPLDQIFEIFDIIRDQKFERVLIILFHEVRVVFFIVLDVFDKLEMENIFGREI